MFYGVSSGKKIGVFTSWDETREYVEGVSGAKFKKFDTYEEAEMFVMGENMDEYEKDTHCEVIAYVDGSYNKETNTVGAGVYFIYPDGKTYNLGGKFNNTDDTRNVLGELKASEMAICMAILGNYDSIEIRHDYLGISEWANGNWRTKQDITRRYKRNVDALREIIDVQFVKVMAHRGIHGNEVADRIAKEACGIV